MSQIDTRSSETLNQDPVHFMVDLETLDTTATSIILSIGACVVPKVMDPCDLDTLYIEVHVDSQYMRTKSLDTMNWWDSQGNCPDKGTILLPEALGELREYFLTHTTKPIIWCKGTDFDVAILAHAYKQYEIPLPWKYNDVREFRTVKKLFGDQMVVKEENSNPHHALCDAVYQARQLMALGLELK